MDKELGSAVCLKDGCVEVINKYNPYARHIQAGIAIAIVVAIGILVICLVKRKNKNKVNTQGDNL